MYPLASSYPALPLSWAPAPCPRRVQDKGFHTTTRDRERNVSFNDSEHAPRELVSRGRSPQASRPAPAPVRARRQLGARRIRERAAARGAATRRPLAPEKRPRREVSAGGRGRAADGETQDQESTVLMNMMRNSFSFLFPKLHLSAAGAVGGRTVSTCCSARARSLEKRESTTT